MKIPERQKEIEAFVKEFGIGQITPSTNGHQPTGSPAPLKSDEEVIAKARAEKTGKFDRLWRGDLSVKDDDHSSCDDSFVHKLFFYTQDEDQICRIHAASGLSRDKSTERDDYLRRSIDRARKNVTEFYPWPDGASLGTGRGDDGGDGKKHYTHSDVGNAERFIDRYGELVRWCPERSRFLAWDGKRWAWDEAGMVTKLAQETARSIFEDAAAAADRTEQRAIVRFALASQNTNKINGMLAQAKPHLVAQLAALDADPFLFNVQNGTIDLRTGELRPHNPADLITKISPARYDPEAEAPRFMQFLKETLVDPDVVEFVRRFAGYSLTGDTRERAVAILHGGGKNGKTTLVELLTNLLGDYAKGADVETFLAKRYQGVGNDVAALKGARFVPTSEVEKGRRLAESKVKALTGRDTITARFLFCEPFEFQPEFKIWLSTNNKPEIKGTDDAIWDRIRLIPFTQRFTGEQQDKGLPAKLKEELDGVLAWAVAGCLAWLREGLGEPEGITAATQEYREEMDTLSAFIEDECVVARGTVVKFSVLFKRYNEWCARNSEAPEKRRSFSDQLNARGFETYNGTGNAVFVRGLELRSDDPNGPTLAATKKEKVNYLEAETDSDDHKNGQSDALVVNSLEEELTILTPENTCKTAHSDEGVNDSYPKSKSSGLENPRERKSQKNVNKVNSLTHEGVETPLSDDLARGEVSTLPELKERREKEDEELIAHGWQQRDRGDNTMWISPKNDCAYARDVALNQIKKEEEEERF